MKRDTARDILPPGSVFEKYTVYKRLGSGGMGAVYLVKHNLLDTLFALKILHPETAQQDGSFVSRFIREAKLASALKHPNLIEVHDAGHNAATGIYYIVMDYVSGGSLRSRLSKTGKLGLAESLQIITGIAHALNAAHHAGIVHRDIKPENIMFDADGTAKLADLGIAKVSEPSGSALTMTSTVFGTPAYMSPEQAMDSSKVDCRADIYSLGIVFFEMLAGRLPFDGSTPIELLSQLISATSLPDIRVFCKDIPEDTAQLIEDMTRKDVKMRIQTPEELLYRLGRLSQGADAAGDPAENRSPDAAQYDTLPTVRPPDAPQKPETQAVRSSVPESVSKTVPSRRIDARPADWTADSAEIGKKTPGSFNLRSYGKIIAAAVGIPLLLLSAAAVFFFLKTPAAPPPGGNVGRRTGTAVVELEQKASFMDSSAEPEIIPAKKQVQLPSPHSVIILGPADFRSGLLPEQLKKTAGKQIFLTEIESPGRFRDQIRLLLSCNPDMMILVPIRHFVRSGISLATFEMLLSEAVDQIHEKNVPILVVCSKPVVTRKEKDFFDMLKHICARRSLDFKTVDQPVEKR